MAQIKHVELIDDLDGKTARGVKTVQFMYNRTMYEIELSEAHRKQFDKVMAKYVDAARVTVHPPNTNRGSREPGLRKWARANGWPTLTDKEPISEALLEAYNSRND